MKPVLLLVVDAISHEVVSRAMRQDKLPTMQALRERGDMSPCLSIFPSITPAATASIITGAYPSQHGIGGAFWYDDDRDVVHYFGDDLWVILERGPGNFVQEFMIRLNRDLLRSPTLFEELQLRGQDSATINFLWYRGKHDHDIDAPLLLKLTPGLDFSKTVSGPRWAFIGDFVRSRLPGGGDPPTARGGMTRRYGFHDETTADYFRALLTDDEAPLVSVVYFPNNDYDSHDRGPEGALDDIIAFDELLAEVAAQHGGLDALLDRFAIIIVGDHSQCPLDEEEESRTVNLEERLAEWRVAKAGSTWQEGDELMVCPNMRAALVIPRSERTWEVRRVAQALLEAPEVDQVIYRADGRYVVATSDRGELRFGAVDREADANARDAYGNLWRVEGDLSTIDASLGDDGVVRYGVYPNSLERIGNCYIDDRPAIWVTARIGKEFCLPNTTVHRGGSHGSLHETDTNTLLLTAGLPERVAPPRNPRIVDVMQLCIDASGADGS